MRFSDPCVVFPHLSALPWEEFDSGAQMWIQPTSANADAAGVLPLQTPAPATSTKGVSVF
jgi:hypothetical protein